MRVKLDAWHAGHAETSVGGAGSHPGARQKARVGSVIKLPFSCLYFLSGLSRDSLRVIKKPFTHQIWPVA